jgi:hypothetical protein
MDNMITTEVLGLLETLRREGGGGRREVRVGGYVTPCVLNVLWVLVTGARFSSWDDPRLQRLMQLMSQRARVFDMCGGTLNQFPWTRFVAPQWTGYRVITSINDELKAIIMVKGALTKAKKRSLMDDGTRGFPFNPVPQLLYSPPGLTGLCKPVPSACYWRRFIHSAVCITTGP